MNEFLSQQRSARGKVPIMRSIGARLLRIVLSIYIIVAVSVTAVLIVEEYVGSKRGVFRELHIYEKTFEAALANSLWAMDHDELQSIIQGMVEIPEILGVKVVDPSTGWVFASAGLITSPDEAQEAETRTGLFSEVFGHTFQVLFHHETGADPVGRVSIYSDSYVVIERIKGRVALILASAAIKAVALWLIFLYVSRAILSRPLTKLVEATERLDLDRLDNSRIHTGARGQNELTVLEESFNNMIQRLQQEAAEKEDYAKNLSEGYAELQELKDSLEEQVIVRTKELSEANEVLREKTHDLGKRVKELNCLYGISRVRETPGISLADAPQGIVDLIPPSWQYPEITCARIILEGQEFKTKNFKETIWKQASEIIVHGERLGTLEVFYLEERPESDEGPFLKEERNLINAVSERLGRIIERTRVEVALRESETKYRSLVEQIPAVMYIAELDEANTILYISPQVETLLGFSQAEYRDDPGIWRKQLHPEDKERVLAEVARSRENSKSFALEYRMLTRDGRVVWLRDESVIVQDAAGKPLYLQGLMLDVSERRQTEEHIRELNQQLMKAQENERQMISCELHDQVAQDLSALKITCETLLDNQSEVPCEVRQGLSELSRTLQKTIKTVRDLSYDLRPSSLDQLGLVRTIFQYCEDFSTKNGASVDFSSAGMDSLSLDFDTEINLYRLLQEGLNNIKKHADASHVTIRLVGSYPKIILRIEDDGKGFDVKDRLVAAFHEKRMGLRSMEERVGLLQGKMRIQSSQAKGTRIFIEIPYKEKKDGSQEEHIYR